MKQVIDHIQLIKELNELPRGFYKLQGVSFIKIITGETDRGHGYSRDYEQHSIVLLTGEIVHIPEIELSDNSRAEGTIKFCKYFNFVPPHYVFKCSRDDSIESPGAGTIAWINLLFDPAKFDLGYHTNKVDSVEFVEGGIINDK